MQYKKFSSNALSISISSSRTHGTLKIPHTYTQKHRHRDTQTHTDTHTHTDTDTHTHPHTHTHTHTRLFFSLVLTSWCTQNYFSHLIFCRITSSVRRHAHNNMKSWRRNESGKWTKNVVLIHACVDDIPTANSGKNTCSIGRVHRK